MFRPRVPPSDALSRQKSGSGQVVDFCFGFGSVWVAIVGFDFGIKRPFFLVKMQIISNL